MSQLNDLLLRQFNSYYKFTVEGKTFPVPYFINYMGEYFSTLFDLVGIDQTQRHQLFTAYRDKKILYGWDRGKGTPSQIREAIHAAFQKEELDINNATEEGILNIMKLYGIGIDCSGLVFNMLYEIFDEDGKKDKFIQSLAWKEGTEPGVTRAGCFVFAGRGSYIISTNDLRPGDILMMNRNGVYKHMAICMEDSDGLFFGHAGLNVSPSGVNKVQVAIHNSHPVFTMMASVYPDWNELWEQNIIELRRLVAIDQLYAQTASPLLAFSDLQQS